MVIKQNKDEPMKEILNSISGEERALFIEWWCRIREGYPEIPASVLAAGLGRIFCEKMHAERADKPDASGSTIFWFSEPCWESLGHILEWQKRSVKEMAPWLADADERGRPKRLLGHLRYIDLEREADKDMDARCEQLNRRLGLNDEVTVEHVGDGYRIVRLLTPDAVALEAGRMRHQFGLGDDQEQFMAGEIAYYSLRRADGFPVATLQVEFFSSEEGMLMRIEGHRNTPVSDEDREILLPWLRQQGWGGVDFHCGLMEEEKPLKFCL
ncbi:hypothetical protein ACLBWS_16550 [Brucellaceae bacterium D45D]